MEGLGVWSLGFKGLVVWGLGFQGLGLLPRLGWLPNRRQAAQNLALNHATPLIPTHQNHQPKKLDVHPKPQTQARALGNPKMQ